MFALITRENIYKLNNPNCHNQLQINLQNFVLIQLKFNYESNRRDLAAIDSNVNASITSISLSKNSENF